VHQRGLVTKNTCRYDVNGGRPRAQIRSTSKHNHRRQRVVFSYRSSMIVLARTTTYAFASRLDALSRRRVFFVVTVTVTAYICGLGTIVIPQGYLAQHIRHFFLDATAEARWHLNFLYGGRSRKSALCRPILARTSDRHMVPNTALQRTRRDLSNALFSVVRRQKLLVLWRAKI